MICDEENDETGRRPQKSRWANEYLLGRWPQKRLPSPSSLKCPKQLSQVDCETGDAGENARRVLAAAGALTRPEPAPAQRAAG